MKLIIDIPEMAYEAYKEWHKNKVATVEQSIIANGKLYEEKSQSAIISRKGLQEDLRRFFPTEVLEGIEPKTLFAQIMHDIDNAPTVKINDKSLEIAQKSIELGLRVGKAEGKAERPQGEWQKVGKYACECSICGESVCGDFMNFCPNCGADMRKGGAENDT